MKNILHSIVLLSIIACNNNNKIKVDCIYVNGKFIAMDSTTASFQAMVIEDGKILAMTTDADATLRYAADSVIDLKGATAYPAWHDAHAHFWGYGMSLQQVDLSGCKSWEEVVTRCSLYYYQHKPDVLLGRGWDQNLWRTKDFPDNTSINSLFPDIPVLLKRIDGHAAIANAYLLKLAGVHSALQLQGGKILVKNNSPTGVLIDNAVDYVSKKLPPPSVQTQIKALLAAQDSCFAYGITTITDAGLPTHTILLIDSLQQAGQLHIRMNCMVSIDSASVSYWLKRGVYNTPNLRVGSFKMYADGALGSRGACLIDKYHDANHHGLIITDQNVMKHYIERVAKSEFQLNTHCIGDSANRMLLRMYAQALGKQKNRRWRIEHAQVMHPDDYSFYAAHAIIPSVQPTHATSDMYWAKDRLGESRIKHAYAYQQLLAQNGWLPLGTDFPVEKVNPLLTYLAATQRKDVNGYPEKGFQSENSLTHWQTLYGMTTWAARAAFMENTIGDFRPGMSADFVLYSSGLEHLTPAQLSAKRPQATVMNGKRVY